MTFLQLDETALSQVGAIMTAREIAQQPGSWVRTGELVRHRADSIGDFLKPLLARPDLRIILTGAGSSSFIGECLAPLMLRALGRRVEAIATTDLLSGPHLYLQKDAPTLLVSFGRSGSSPESVAVIAQAQQLLTECHQLVFTCNERGELYQRLAAWLVFCGGRGARTVAAIGAAAGSILDNHNTTLKELAANSYSRVVYLGSNAFKSLAHEAALKLLELTDGGVIGAFDSPLGFRHGPKSIVSADTLLFVFMSNDPYARRYELDLLYELRSEAVAGRVIAITAQTEDAATDGDYLHIQHASDASDGELLFPYIICGQLYAFHRALSLGNQPDQPSKSRTVSRVVSGVSIHSL